MNLLQALRRIDSTDFTIRDIIVLRTIMENPGECGTDLCKRLGIANRSSIASNFPRLIARGMIVDLRTREAQAIPGRYYVTEAGMDFWREIVS